MKQSRWASFAETATSTAAGFGLSLALQWVYFDLFLGFPLHISQNVAFALIMTAVSLARGYTIRRLFEWAGLRTVLSVAMQAVIAERARQIKGEAFSAAHDDAHEPGELAKAGVCYILAGVYPAAFGGPRPPALWPWEAKWWKPKGHWRDLVRGVALVLAEMDRSLRGRRTAPLPPIPHLALQSVNKIIEQGPAAKPARARAKPGRRKSRKAVRA
ncbi:MAG: hypothetical protein ACK4UO_06075 [Pseudolabrys sp.]